jgi:hypothetical protein
MWAAAWDAVSDNELELKLVAESGAVSADELGAQSAARWEAEWGSDLALLWALQWGKESDTGLWVARWDIALEGVSAKVLDFASEAVLAE